ncbi:MAG: pyridoxamine 5'-phosphate oxidase family protein [Acidimicrobiales bacterium]
MDTQGNMNGAILEELQLDACVNLLRSTAVGRIAFLLETYPVVFPVNYRLVGDGEEMRLLLQTRPGNTIDKAHQRVGFQIDGLDNTEGGWSVLVRGKMQHLRDPAHTEFLASLDPTPWVPADRDAWIAIEPVVITGRRLRAGGNPWPFDVRGYW